MLYSVREKVPAVKRAKNAAIFLIIFFIAWSVSARFAASTYYIDDVGVTIDTEPSWGGTSTISLPPLGDIIANTHKAPVSIKLTLMRINGDFFKTLKGKETANSNDIVKTIKNDTVSALVKYFTRLFAGVAIVSFFLAWIFPLERSVKRACCSSVISVFLLLSVLLVTVVSYNYRAFTDARLDGLINDGAAILSTVNDALGGTGTFASKTYNLWGNIQSLMGNVGGDAASLGTSGDVAYKVIVVSDYHSSVIGINFLMNLAKEINPLFVVDCGDINDLGSLEETMAVANLRNLKLPYIFIPGNHDKQVISEYVERMPQGYVVTNGAINVSGFTIAGFADPYYNLKKIDDPTYEGKKNLSKKEAKCINEWMKKNGYVDIMITHRESIAKLITTGSGIIFTGHTHKLNIFKNASGVWVINPGTTGAGGIRGLAADIPPPYSAVIVYFDKNKKAIGSEIVSFSPENVSEAVNEQGLPEGPSRVQMTRLVLN